MCANRRVPNICANQWLPSDISTSALLPYSLSFTNNHGERKGEKLTGRGKQGKKLKIDRNLKQFVHTTRPPPSGAHTPCRRFEYNESYFLVFLRRVLLLGILSWVMATAAIIGLSTGKRLLTCSFCSTDLVEKLFPAADHNMLPFFVPSTKCIIVSQKSSHFGVNVPPTRYIQSIKALKEHVNTWAPSTSVTWSERPDLESSLEVLILLQKSMLEKQLELPFMDTTSASVHRNSHIPAITHSGISARKRRLTCRRKCFARNNDMEPASVKSFHFRVSPELLKSDLSGYLRGFVSENLLTHAEVVNLSKKIKAAQCWLTPNPCSETRRIPEYVTEESEERHKDPKLDNNPWHGFEEWSLKRERDIIRLYHSIDSECHTWEEIGKQFGLSRERVRQVGLVSMEKLKHVARRRRLEAMLMNH
ncbi:hypothetical protein ZIOFF_061720 [Zingiber officinale]|uniref:RNA polymerase sigma-70 region 4 domain-containing protein n=1 Tax=Zingiber officinale TaxID=94328 RepID=A0A8J5K8M8_ZINOF|nr:hypothetical protein ZIOFF_061720 [Zingiber officinale]